MDDPTATIKNARNPRQSAETLLCVFVATVCCGGFVAAVVRIACELEALSGT